MQIMDGYGPFDGGVILILGPEEPNSWIVCKFGGSSVATAANWHNILGIVRNRSEQSSRILLVCSALKGVTDKFEKLLSAAKAGDALDTLLRELHDQHEALAADLGFQALPLIEDILETLHSSLAQVSRFGCLPKMRAQVMACGELMSTRLGAEFLARQGLSVGWQDARDLLTSAEADGDSQATDFLSAHVPAEPDKELQLKLFEQPQVVVTQGFIARSPAGDTVLLGRGGSDTSAAYFAAKLQAERLEIWTDVPGMFSANPHHVPDARLIRNMLYDEAEAVALGGGKVLHPRCLAPVRDNDIPLHIKCTSKPEMVGTVISNSVSDEGDYRFSAVSSRSGLYWIEADVGTAAPLALLPKFSESFGKRGLHVSALTTSHRSLQAAIDPLVTPIERGEVAKLLDELNDFSDAVIDTNVDSLSLIGRGIDRIYHELGPLFHSLEQAEVRHVGNYSGMDVTLLFSQTEIDDLVHDIHTRLLSSPEPCNTFGPTWEEIQQQITTGAVSPTSV